MSWKLYNAHRLRPGFDMWETACDIRTKAAKRVKDRLRTMYAVIVADWKASDTAGGDGVTRAEATKLLGRVPNGYFDASRLVRKLYTAQLSSYDRNVFDLSVCVAWRRVGRRWLITRFAGSGMFTDVLEFMTRHKALEDFHYQTSSDRPSNISAARWAARGRAWQIAHGDGNDNNWQNMLVTDIVSPTSWPYICPATDMLREEVDAIHAKSRKRR